MKKILFVLTIFILLTTFVKAASVDIEFPNGNEFSPGEEITFKATIYDDSGKPLEGPIEITIQDSEKTITKSSIDSTKVTSIDLKNAASGQGIITAEAQNAKAIAFFDIGREELASFELDKSNLIVTNIGNTPYERTITITIGDTVGTQTPHLEIGESVTYRLIAPEGDYNIKVTDGKTSLIRGGIKLSGTGNVIGAIDDSASNRAGITGGVSPEEGDIAILSYIKQNKFIYVFVAVIFAATILIAIERQYRKNAKR